MSKLHPDQGARLLYEAILEGDLWCLEKLAPLLNRRIAGGAPPYHVGMLIVPAIQYTAICNASARANKLVVPPFAEFEKDD